MHVGVHVIDVIELGVHAKNAVMDVQNLDAMFGLCYCMTVF